MACQVVQGKWCSRKSVRIVRVLELLGTQLLHIIYLHKVRGHSRASGAARWSLIALPGFYSHWITDLFDVSA